VQLVYGQGGSDTYQVAAANGSVRMVRGGENDAIHSGTDTLEFVDLALSDMSFRTLGNGDLRMTWNTGTDAGFVQLADGGKHIERFEFSDGSVLGSIEVDVVGSVDRLTGTSADDTIVGSDAQEYIVGGNGDDIIDAGGTDGGVQLVYGQGGSDTYQVAAANGSIRMVRGGENDAIHSGTDTLHFTDLNRDDIDLSTLGSGDVRLTWNTGTDTGFVQLADGGNHIEQFEFANGTLLDHDELFV